MLYQLGNKTFVLTSLQQQTLLAAVDRIIPADEFPSASQAGALAFITGLLASDLSDRKSIFIASLDALHAEAIQANGKSLAELDIQQQDAVIERLESNRVTADWPMSAPGFLQLLIRLTAEGYYSDPGNGGNKDSLSWKMVGYDAGANGPDGLYVGRRS